MSLKAKLEAVIYAAEEPVTLAQLTALFAGEALEWKREREAAAEAAKAAEPATPEAAENAGLPLNEAFAFLEIEENAASASEGPADAGDETTTAQVAPDAGQSEKAEVGGETAPEPDAADTEAEAKREARLREREARAAIRILLDELIAEYAADSSGIEIREIAGGYRMATKPEFHEVVRTFVKSLKAPLKLSLPALETLAVIAYKQPVTAPEVNEIRGVDSSAVFGSLLARKLISTAGRKPVVGRPILYKTTKEFLLRFGLKDVSELPSMEEFEKMAASELEEPAMAAASEEPAEFSADMSLETEERESEDNGDRNGAADSALETEQPAPEAARRGAE
jgi:segregation and condensation protein B